MSKHVNSQDIRSYCDGELAAERAEEFERLAGDDGALRARLAFERELHRHVGIAMAPVALPADLERRVRAALAREPFGGAEAPDRPVRLDGRGSWLAGPTRANLFAVAASLALVAGAVLFGIFGHPIDTLRIPHDGLMNQTAAFVSAEHTRCAARREALTANLSWKTPESARQGLAHLLDAPVCVVDLASAGFRFLGAGACHLPGDVPSGHVLYGREASADEGCPQMLVSIFVVGDLGQFAGALNAGAAPWEWTQVADEPQCGKAVACCSDGTVVYFLVTCDDSQLGRLGDLVSRAAAASR